MRKPIAVFVIVVTLLASPPVRAEDAALPLVDLALVLAVDVSGSVDAEEYALQMGGIAAAFRDAAVQRAIAGGPLGRIAVSLVLWADPQDAKAATPWTTIATPAEAAAFAALVESQPRGIPAGSTGIGDALYFCTRLIRDSAPPAARRAIDLSGDGRETAPRDYFVRAGQGRAAALAAGITVNGLAILTDEPDLDGYYRAEVIAGPGAFVIAAAGYADFAAAMREKLQREIKGQPVVGWNWIDGSVSIHDPDKVIVAD